MRTVTRRIITFHADDIRAGQGNINLSTCTMALRNKGEESVRKIGR